MFGLIKKIFIRLLTDLVNGSNQTNCMLLSNEKCMVQPFLINLHRNEYSQKFHYYPFAVKLDICGGSCNTLNDLSNKESVPNTTEDLNVRVLKMITVINGWKTLTKHISCECKCRFGGRKCNSDQWCNNDKSQCECKKRNVCEKDYVWNPSRCNCKNGKYLANIMVDSAIMCDEVIESYGEETKFNEKRVTCKTENIYILLAFLLVTLALLIAVSIYCYLIKYWVIQNYLLPFHFTNNKSKI